MAFGFERRMIMWKDQKKTMIITILLILLPIIVGLIYWDQLPAVMATHFDAEGEANGWSSKWFAVIGLPIFLLAVHCLCATLTGKDPRYQTYPKVMKKIVLWICPVVSWIGSLSIYAYELHWKTDMVTCIYLFVAVTFLVIGNYLPKIKWNYFLGIKLPWTYASEDNWNKTHRFGGKVWVVCGILFLLNVIWKVKFLEVAIMIAMILIPTVYSYLYYIKKESKEDSND